LLSVAVYTGSQQSRARELGAAERTLDGEDRSEKSQDRKERGIRSGRFRQLQSLNSHFWAVSCTKAYFSFIVSGTNNQFPEEGFK
jgi:hypothetical protein